MARFQRITQTQFAIQKLSDGTPKFVIEGPVYARLPQIFWNDGHGWDEANRWFYFRHVTNDVNIDTVDRQAKHMLTYAAFLEGIERDWRHFPSDRKQQVLRLYRKYLLARVKAGTMAGSTARSAMATAIQFYRFTVAYHLFKPYGPLWVERQVVIPYHDSAGFKKSILRVSTDLAIPNRKSEGVRLEEGILPISESHMQELLGYTSQRESPEIHLMLSTGFFSGARIETVSTLTKSSLRAAYEDPLNPGLYLLRVGPGTETETKFDVSGSIFIPEALINDLRQYAMSARRLKNEARATRSEKHWLFLTKKGKRHTPATIGKSMRDMRKRAAKHGLVWAEDFYFHQSRATFGTWLLTILLDSGASPSEAIRIVRDALLHKDEKTTWDYIHFQSSLKGKQAISRAFHQAFTGLTHGQAEKYDEI